MSRAVCASSAVARATWNLTLSPPVTLFLARQTGQRHLDKLESCGPIGLIARIHDMKVPLWSIVDMLDEKDRTGIN